MNEPTFSSADFRVIDSPYALLTCPFCGSPAEMNERERKNTEQIHKVVSCSNGGSDEDPISDECVMYSPSEIAYCATKLGAANIWNRRAQQRWMCVEKDGLPRIDEPVLVCFEDPDIDPEVDYVDICPLTGDEYFSNHGNGVKFWHPILRPPRFVRPLAVLA